MTTTSSIRRMIPLALLALLGGVSPGVDAASQTRLPVLMYHHLVTDEPTSEAELHVDCFRRQMTFLADNGFTALRLEEFEAHHASGRFPERSVLITFDDGYRSFLEHAYPVLEAFGFASVLFPVVSLRPGLQRAIVWSDHLSFHEIRRMAEESELVDVGSHTYDLHHLVDDERAAVLRAPEESRGEHLARVHDDLLLSRLLLERQTDQPITALAWPFGVVEPDAVGVAERLGFALQFTTAEAYVTPETPLTALPRFNVAAGAGACFREVVAGFGR